jgi:hypothetical protein
MNNSKSNPFGDLLKVSAIVFGLVAIGAVGIRLYTESNLVARLRNTEPSAAQSANTLTVDPSKNVNRFDDGMRGVALVNWEHSWGRPFAGETPGLTQALQAIRPGVIRYAGGLWANSVGFDRTAQKTPYTTWTKNGQTYYFHYGTDEIASFSKLAKATGSNVLMQVNIANNDPTMWADMVKYVNKEQGMNFKYWELGNELDHDSGKGVSATEYGTRLQAYQKAMLSADSSIEIHGAAAAFGVNQDDSNSVLSGFMTIPPQAAKAAGKDLGALTWHWYQQCNTEGLEAVLRNSWDSSIVDNSWRNAYVRRWSSLMPQRVQKEALANYPTVKQGITELNVDACNYNSVFNGNHIGALWFADVLGRLAYNGVDYVTAYTGYGEQAYSLLYPDNDQSPSKIFARPTYYTYLMYSQYFGDQMVSSSSPREDVSIWASKDSRDGSALKLMVVNMSSAAVQGQIQTGAFVPTSGLSYTMTSSNPTDSSPESLTAQASTNINGVKVDAMNVAGSLSQISGKSVTVGGSSFGYNLPAYSVTAYVLKSSGTLPPAVPNSTSTPTPAAETAIPTSIVMPKPTIATVPTATPSARPTATPTVAPTKTPVPTVAPTKTALPTVKPTAAPATPAPTQASAGNGLLGQYYSDRTLGTKSFSRVDSQISFNWGWSSPIQRQNDRFSVTWTGFVVAPTTGAYTFYTRADDGVRLWVNNMQIINNWKDHATVTNQANVNLTQGVKTPIRLDYYENRGRAEISLQWSSGNIVRQTVPQSVLYSQ